MGEIVSRTEVAFCFYARSRVPIKISLSALVALTPIKTNAILEKM
jgi:hypothetical protein